MNREESWETIGEPFELLRRVSDLRYVVRVHRISGSALGSVGAFVERHAVDVRTAPPVQQMARVGLAEGGDVDLRGALRPAEAVRL